jgi:DNA invertase Pin-like site-specific DNA recombinase
MGGMKKPKKTPPLPTGTAYGYARVSTDGQSVEAQVRQLTKAGCKKVFREVASGAKTDRAQLRRLLGQLEAGDVLTVTRLDRLARSTRDLLNTLATITGKKAGFRSLGDAWADTTTSHGRLMLTVLGGLAEFERDLIRARTSEGRERAKARGVKMGRKPKLTPHQRQEILRRKESGEALREMVPVQIGRRSKCIPDVARRFQAPITAFQTAGAVRPCAPSRPSRNCPLRMRCISSIPAIVIAACRKSLKPNITAIRCFTPRWSCSIRLFRYFDDRNFVPEGSEPSTLSSRTAR